MRPSLSCPPGYDFYVIIKVGIYTGLYHTLAGMLEIVIQCIAVLCLGYVPRLRFRVNNNNKQSLVDAK